MSYPDPFLFTPMLVAALSNGDDSGEDTISSPNILIETTTCQTSSAAQDVTSGPTTSAGDLVVTALILFTIVFFITQSTSQSSRIKKSHRNGPRYK